MRIDAGSADGALSFLTDWDEERRGRIHSFALLFIILCLQGRVVMK